MKIAIFLYGSLHIFSTQLSRLSISQGLAVNSSKNQIILLTFFGYEFLLGIRFLACLKLNSPVFIRATVSLAPQSKVFPAKTPMISSFCLSSSSKESNSSNRS